MARAMGGSSNSPWRAWRGVVADLARGIAVRLPVDAPRQELHVVAVVPRVVAYSVPQARQAPAQSQPGRRHRAGAPAEPPPPPEVLSSTSRAPASAPRPGSPAASPMYGRSSEPPARSTAPDGETRGRRSWAHELPGRTPAARASCSSRRHRLPYHTHWLQSNARPAMWGALRYAASMRTPAYAAKVSFAGAGVRATPRLRLEPGAPPRPL